MKIAVALSGGVDSSVTALLLAEQGHDLVGLFMKNWDDPEPDGRCPWEQDVEDALGVCDRLGIPLNTVDLAAEYREHVFALFLGEYQAGRTPNPDVLCNREIKFKAFLTYARTLGAERIATGHYARIATEADHFQLLKGVDSGKDQSYFLYALNQQQLAASLFPVGHLLKTEVRRIARAAGLGTHDKRDSTGICFIGERPFREFMSRYLPAQPGEIRDTAGRTLGTHAGVYYYTLGQREGLGIGGVRGAPDAPWYVVDKDVATNVLIVAQGQDHPMLYSDALEASELTWIEGTPPAFPLRCRAKTRYRQTDQDCVVDRSNEDRCVVRFAQPQRAITPGQSVVFYRDEVCLGGGIIQARDRNDLKHGPGRPHAERV